MKNIPEIQLSEFDAITETHTFSKRYLKQKKHLLHAERHHAFSFRTALIAAMITVLTVGGVYAAVSHTEFYKNLWGDTTERQDTPSKEISYVVDKGYVSEGTITLPERQYQNVTPDKAAEILNGYAMELPKSITVRDHTFTAISAIRDGNCVITEFTLECPTGVNALTYSEISDYVHGAIRSDDATFEFNLGYDKIYVDEEHSTDTLWHCYMYSLMTTEAADTSSDITFVTYDADPDMPIQEVYLSDPAASEKLTRQKLSLEIPQNLPSQIYAAASGEYLEISPIGTRINLQEFVDPSGCQMTVYYKDGTDYVVMDDSSNLNNTAAFVVNGSYWYMAFNSLVDTQNIQSIELNGITYHFSEIPISENPIVNNPETDDTTNTAESVPESEWFQKENHYVVGEAVSLPMESGQSDIECMVIDITKYEGGYIEAGVQEYAEKHRPEIVNYRDQACISVKFLVRNLNQEDSEQLLENLQILLSDESSSNPPYDIPFMTTHEAGNIRPDGYVCVGADFLCPKESMNNPFLCLKLKGTELTRDIFFDINVVDPDFDESQYDTRFN